MKRLLLLASVFSLLASLGGCALMSDEDRDFYGRGWVNPKELDNQYPHHAGTPKGTGLDTTTTTTSDPTHTGDGAWDAVGGRPE